MSLYSKLFPGSKCTHSKAVDLGQIFQRLDPSVDVKTPEGQNQLIYQASEGGHVCCYGGFLEDRTFLWEGLYARKKKMKLIHLGVDINNLAAGQPVASLTDGTVFHVLKDHSEQIGWGGRVIIQTGTIYIMYAHLSEQLPKVGTVVKKGQVIGYIGDPSFNGGWFPHLHLQVMTQKYINLYAKRLDEIDGYATVPASMSRAKILQQLTREGLMDPLLFVASLDLPISLPPLSK